MYENAIPSAILSVPSLASIEEDIFSGFNAHGLHIAFALPLQRTNFKICINPVGHRLVQLLGARRFVFVGLFKICGEFRIPHVFLAAGRKNGRPAEDYNNPFGSNFPKPPTSAAVINAEPPTGPVAHIRNLGRLARNLALVGCSVA